MAKYEDAPKFLIDELEAVADRQLANLAKRRGISKKEMKKIIDKQFKILVDRAKATDVL